MQKLVKQFATFLPEHEAARIAQIAKDEDRPAAYIVRRLVCEALAATNERAEA